MLGPLLFLIYINDMPQVIEIIEVLFAGDTTIFGGRISSTLELSSDLVSAKNWFDNNKLTINVDKSCTVYFGSGNRFSAVFDGKPTKVMNSHKYLSFFTDEKLSFNQHVGHVCNCLSRTSGMFFKIKNVLTKFQLLTF